MDPELQRVAAEVSASTLRNSAAVVWDRVRASKAKKIDAETIGELEQIITELLDEKSELHRVAKVYEEALVAQRISDDDIAYITDNIIPVIEEIAGDSANTAVIDQVGSVLSADTVKILQIIGFNFSRGIGGPLKVLMRAAILAKTPPGPNASVEIQRLSLE